MKRLIFLLTIITFSHSIGMAQYSTTADGPSHILNPRFERVIVDTIYYIDHVPNPFDADIYQWDGTSSLTTGYAEIRHSKDGLIDTVFTRSGLARIDIRHYDEKQRLVCIEYDYPPCRIHDCHVDVLESEYFYRKEEFEYDTKNRVSKMTTKEVGSATGKETITSVETFDYSTLVMTSKGYIYDGYEYELDESNRITYLKDLNAPEEYLKPDEFMELDGKKYRIGDSYYTYFEGGFSVFRYERTSYWMLGWADRWSRTENFYSESGIIVNTYYSLDGKEWEVWEKLESRYAYVDGEATNGADPNQNEKIQSPLSEVYGLSGAIIVNTDNNAEVSIYNTTGGMVKKQIVNSGTTQISMPQRGLYFVIVNNKSYKVIVK